MISETKYPKCGEPQWMLLCWEQPDSDSVASTSETCHTTNLCPCCFWARWHENLLLHYRYLWWIFWVPFQKHIYVGFIPSRPSKAISRTRCSTIQPSQCCYPPSYSGREPFFLFPSLFDTLGYPWTAVWLPMIVEVTSSSWCSGPGFPSLLLTPLHLGRPAALPANDALFNSIKIIFYNVMGLTKYFGWLRVWVKITKVSGKSRMVQKAPGSLFLTPEIIPSRAASWQEGQELVQNFSGMSPLILMTRHNFSTDFEPGTWKVLTSCIKSFAVHLKDYHYNKCHSLVYSSNPGARADDC